MTGRLPTSTLFPYTTLFRSARGRLPSERRFMKTARWGLSLPALAYAFPLTRPARARDDPRPPGIPAESAVDPLDRKSTRLNSSHVKISYAVFCLKKKKTRCLLIRIERRLLSDLVRRTHSLTSESGHG